MTDVGRVAVDHRLRAAVESGVLAGLSRRRAPSRLGCTRIGSPGIFGEQTPAQMDAG